MFQPAWERFMARELLGVEVLSGLKAGDQVITGPFSSVRNLQDGDAVKMEAPQSRRR